MTELRDALSTLRRHLPNLDVAAIPTKCEVFAICGSEARELHDAIEVVLASVGRDSSSQEAVLREQVSRPDGPHFAGTSNPMPREFAEELRDKLLSIAESKYLLGRYTIFGGEIRRMSRIVKTAALCLGRTVEDEENRPLPDTPLSAGKEGC